MGTRPPSPVDELEGSTKQCVGLGCLAAAMQEQGRLLFERMVVCACVSVLCACVRLQAGGPRTGRALGVGGGGCARSDGATVGVSGAA